MQPPVFKRSKLSAEQQAVALRIREERKLGKFSQAELAFESGIGRASLTHYEYAITAMPFGAGVKFCRRLDLNPIWLATGEEPKRPYIPLTDLGLDPKIEDLYEGTFLDGYRELLAKPLRKWWSRLNTAKGFKSFVHERANNDNVFARMSKLALERFIRAGSAEMRESTDLYKKLARLENILIAGMELRRRLQIALKNEIHW